MRALVVSENITGRDDHSIDRYFNEIKKINLISAKEEIMLAPKIRQGEMEALKVLVTTNLRFVVTVAKQYQSRGVCIGDLINEGNIGLIHAAKRFDETKGFKFISFAVWSIRQAIISALAEQSRMVHIPYNQISLLSKFYKGSDRLEQKYARKPTVEEVADYLKVDLVKMEDLRFISRNEVSLDKPFSEEVGETLLDVLSTDEFAADPDLIKDSRRKVIEQSLLILNKRDREIIILHFGLSSADPLSLEKIAQKMGLSIEHTRRLKDYALKKLKDSSYSSSLKSCIH